MATKNIVVNYRILTLPRQYTEHTGLLLSAVACSKYRSIAGTWRGVMQMRGQRRVERGGMTFNTDNTHTHLTALFPGLPG